MALDNANFIAELSITDPPGTDPLSQGDDQIRTIKRATFQSFPLIAAAVNITDAQMNEMAIKNETNLFTVDQQFNRNVIVDDLTGTTEINCPIWRKAGVTRWQFQMTGTDGDLRLRRFDGIGAFLDDPWRIALATGIVDFLNVPTVQGAPLWIAGELRMFVNTQTPGTNWFKADGTNGTLNCSDRWLQASGTDPVGTTRNPNLVGTAAAGTTGSTAITTAQMPSHNHNLRGIVGGGGGITDVAVGFVSNETIVGANRGAIGASYVDLNSNGNEYVQSTGSGSGHTHTSPAQAVTENGTGFSVVQPLTRVVDMFQYVP